MSSITTTCTSSNLPPLEAAYAEVDGRSASWSHSSGSKPVLSPTVCCSNQSLCELYDVEYPLACPIATPVGVAVILPVLLNAYVPVG